MTFNSTQDPQPAVEYRAVCRNLPVNAHWTDGSTRKEIPQTESSPNVWIPSPVGTYSGTDSLTECHFVCDDGYERTNGVCEASGGITYDPNAGTISITDGTTTYTIMDKNLGATVAGTGKLHNQDGCTTTNNGTSCWSESIGDYFQRGNNYGFANSGTLLATTSTRPNASGY
ncbi:MAG: hypothetical protein LBG59_05320 [Candidatus Peribacteria bacterium]|jgi:hypothetical protein|nr:hypothetical protein [Candidatus Peribacteria bacterium]